MMKRSKIFMEIKHVQVPEELHDKTLECKDIKQQISQPLALLLPVKISVNSVSL